MKFLGTVQTKQIIPMLLDLDRKVFGLSQLYTPSPLVIERVRHPMNVLSSATSNDGKQLLGYFSMVITQECFFRELLGGKVQEESAPPWTGKEEPILFIRDLVVQNCQITPFLFRYAIRDLRELCHKSALRLKSVFSIAYSPQMLKTMDIYRFKRAGLYHAKYPIMLAQRPDSRIFQWL